MSVTYVDSRGREFEQPAELVLLCSYVLNNVRLMLQSGIGKPYDPVADTGVVGRNYAYQTPSSVTLFFEDKHFNSFMGAGGLGMSVDEFNGDNFDHTGLGFIGGGFIRSVSSGSRPIEVRPVPAGTPRWGSAWKKATAQYFNRSFGLALQGACQSYRGNYLDLDPTYRDAYGLPLLRMTFDRHENEHRMSRYITGKAAEIAQGDRAVEDERQPARRQVHHRALPEHAQHRRRGDGRRSGDQRGQQVPAELGRAERVRDRRERVPAERRLQPDRHRGRAHLLGARRDQGPLSQAAGAARLNCR